MIKVFLVDEHKIFKEGLKIYLNNTKEISVIGEIEDGKSSLQKIFKLEPDIIIIDIKLDGKVGLDLVSEIIKKDPRLKIIIFSYIVEKSYILKSLEYGIKAYLSKNCKEEELINCINIVQNGGLYYPQDFFKEMERTIREKYESKIATSFETLTKKEKEILQLISEGKIIKEIAEEYRTCSRSIDRIILNIKNKLNIFEKASLIKYYIKNIKK